MTGFEILHAISYSFRIKKSCFRVTTLLIVSSLGKRSHLLTLSWDYVGYKVL